MVFFLFFLLMVLCCLSTDFDASNVAKSKEEEEMTSSLMQAGSSSRRPWTGCWLLKVRACAEYIGLTVMGVLLFIAEEPCGDWTRRVACRASFGSAEGRRAGKEAE